MKNDFMRYILTTIIIIFLAYDCLSQINEIPEIPVSDTITLNDEIIDPIENYPIFPGGDDSLWCFVESKLNFEILNNSNYQGKVFVFFDIDITGKVINVKTNPDITQRLGILVNDSLIENEIKRVIKLLPNWTPALLGEKPIRVSYTLPIKIPYTDFKCNKLDNPTSVYWKVDEYAKFQYEGEKETKESIEKFIGNNGIWPSQDDCFGKVYVRVIIDELGKLSDFKILRGLDGCQGFNEEALRLVGLMPMWIPAEIDGKPVKSYIVIPINFMLR